MRIGRPFSLKNIQNKEDIFIPLRVKCKTCKRSFKIIAIEVYASSILYGSRSLQCMKCDNYWEDSMESLGIEGRDADRQVLRVSIPAGVL